MARKTFDVQSIKEWANNVLSLDTVNDDEKKGVALMLERILLDSGNYHGFRILDRDKAYDVNIPTYECWERSYY